MIIRPYEDEDYYQLTNLYKVPSLYGGQFDEERDSPNRLRETSDTGDLLVAVDEVGLLIGSVMILSNPHSFWLLRFVIDDKHPEHEAAARSLMNTVEQIARARDHSNILVYSSAEFQNLTDRYRKLDFHEGNDYKVFWKEVNHEV